ncbi:hypothetical protein [Legionella fairfieldensis]|uniref:hypothetical protein n=1 Tax=Legionella fairfieldensis TaxID=45064 RepID=UPI00049158DA|nr:hypothetical protein [Legionella fairfieldensis]
MFNSINTDVDVNDDDEFFIALCQSGFHSYIVAGVQRKGQFRLLLSVGKYSFSTSLTLIKEVLFSHSKAFLSNEYLAHGRYNIEANQYDTPREVQASYSAYAINYIQYLKLIDLIEKASPFIRCYRPVEQTGSLIKLEWRQGNNQGVNPSVIDNINNLTIRNTCRTTALDIVDYIAHPLLSAKVSRKFYKPLPLKTIFQNGYAQHLYILPQPLDAKKTQNISPLIREVFIDIYKRLDDLLCSTHRSISTREKFEAIKNVYNELITCDKNDLPAFKRKMEHLIISNQGIIFQHRNYSLILKKLGHKTASENLFIKINKRIEKQIQNTLGTSTSQSSSEIKHSLT